MEPIIIIIIVIFNTSYGAVGLCDVVFAVKKLMSGTSIREKMMNGVGSSFTGCLEVGEEIATRAYLLKERLLVDLQCWGDTLSSKNFNYI